MAVDDKSGTEAQEAPEAPEVPQVTRVDEDPQATEAMGVSEASDDRYLDKKQVRRRYGDKSDMTLWRWRRDPDLGFPKPVTIRGQLFWLESKLKNWERGLK